jgi:glycosyltransferase involved in cell wall biosynthesis
LPTWLACLEIGEIVVVDWSSEDSVFFASVPSDSRVVVARVEGQKHWVASRCHNLGLDLARGDWILRLDADDRLDRSFFAEHPLREASFYCFNDDKACDDNDRHLMGVVFASKRHLLDVSGYNERLTFYGYEDEDLVARLRAGGLVALPLDLGTVHHLPHDDESRTGSQLLPTNLDRRPPWGSWSWRPSRLIHDLADRNKHAALEKPWSRKDVRASWAIEMVVPGYYVCKEQGA